MKICSTIILQKFTWWRYALSHRCLLVYRLLTGCLKNVNGCKHTADAGRIFMHCACACTADEIGFEPVTVESLRADKMFVKLVKKQQKELELLNKMHVKERSVLQKQQCTVMDKMVAGQEKEKLQVEKVTEKTGKKKR